MLKARSRSNYPIRVKLLSFLVVFSFLAAMFSGVLPAYAQEPQSIFYVNPVSGNDSNSGDADNPLKTIEEAKNRVREINSSMTGDIEIVLRGGTYQISDTIAFTEADSGFNGYNVIYKAYPGETPILSGGKDFTGWELHDEGKNIYKAVFGSDIETRQLYINDVRATRARSEGEIEGTWTTDANGSTTTYTSILEWGNISDVELVYKITWTNPRCGIQSVSENNGIAIVTMKQPGWANYRNRFSDQTPWYIENAYELLDNEGEWYLDRTEDTFYYIPREGENMETAVATVGVTEQLMTLHGSNLDNPVHNIQFQGISFKYATWLGPSSDSGHIDEQSNIVQGELATAAIDMKTAKSVIFERCSFSKLGGAAVNMTNGCQDNLIEGCTFTDISASGVQVGTVNADSHTNPANTKELLKNNDILNSYFNSLGVEYRSAVAIFAAFPMNMDIKHNEISSLPYSGLSLGWGWGVSDTSTRENNIQNNYIHNVMNVLYDGGAIYTLGTQHDTLISGNYLKDQKLDYGAIYLDGGTSDILVENNVIENVPTALFVNPSRNHILRSNYSNNYRTVDVGTNNIVEPPIYVGDGNWPQPALDIISNAGIQEEYEDIIPNPAPNLIPEIPAPGPIIRPEHVQIDFTGKSSMVTGFENGTRLRNTYSGLLGMKMTVGSSDIKVTALGRLMTPDSKGVHDLYILDFDTRAEVAKAAVNMLGQSSNSNGAFMYAQLAEPVTLEANKAYYLVSSEMPTGDDLWFDGDLKVTNTDAVTVNNSVFNIHTGEFIAGGGAGTTFVGLDLLYDIGGTTKPQAVELPQVVVPITGFPPIEEEQAITTPVDIDGTEGFINDITTGKLRNDYSGSVGMKITVGEEDIAVTSLGRLFADGNNGQHKLRIVDGSTAREVSATIVDMAGGSNNQFIYANLPAPVKLKAGRSYYIVSDEEFGQDYWYECDTTITGKAAASVDSAAYSTEIYVGADRSYQTYSGANHSYVGVDFRYTTDTSIADDENMIHNGSFEEGIAAWETYNSVISRTTEGTLNNSKGSARVDVVASEGFAGQGVALETGKTYELSVWARLETGNRMARFVIEPNFSLFTEQVPIDTTWRQFKHTFTYNGTSGDFARVEFRVDQGATNFTYYFDDFRCVEVVGTVPDGIITNGDFETDTNGWNASNCELSRETAITHNGSAGSAKITPTIAYGHAEQYVELEKGKEYEVSAWVKLDSGDPYTAKFVFSHGDNEYGESVSENVYADTWTQLKWNYTYTQSHDDGNGHFWIFLGGGAGDAVGRTFYLDDVVIKPIVDKTALIAAIENATTLIASKTAGTEVGNVPQAAKDAYQTVIDAAVSVKNDSSATQEAVDNQVTALAAAAEAFNSAVIQEPADIIANGDFETDTNGWTMLHGNMEWEATITHNGSAGSAKITPTSAYGHAEQYVELEKGKEYEVSAWVKLDSGDPYTAKFVFSHGDNEYGESVSENVYADTWTQLKWNYTYTQSHDDGNGHFWIFLGGGAGDAVGRTFYLDDVVIKPVAPVVVDKEELIEAIEDATTLIASKTVGTEVGNVPQAAKDAYQTAIEAAVSVKDDSSATQEAVDNQVTALAAAAEAFISSVIQEPADIIVNGDFESDTNGWTMQNGNMEWENGITHNGSAGSAKITPTRAHGHAEQYVELEKGKEYEVSAWVKLDSGDPYTAKFVFDHDGQYGESGSVDVYADTWTQLKWNYTYTQSHDNGNGSFWIFLGDGAGDAVNRTFYLDDVVIKPAAPVVVDKTALIAAIEDATELIASKTVGTEVGNVPQTAKDAYQTAIDAAVSVENDSSATQEAVDDQVIALAAAAEAFISSVITETEPEEKFTVTTTFKVGSTSNATALAANQMVYANSSITNNQSTDQTVMLIVALYDNNGDMVNISYIAKTVKAGGTESFNAGFRLPSAIEGYQVKAFVWDGNDPESSSMTPISNVVSIQ